MKHVSARGALAAAAACALALSLSVVASARLSTNPANDSRLVSKPIEDFRYDHAKGCKSDPQKGTLALAKWLDRNLRGVSWGIMRCERLGSGYSLHSEGRALDWHLDARNAAEKQAAMKFIHTLLERDRNGQQGALARRMGVQGLIFNCQSWWAGQEGLGKYSYCYKPNGDRKSGLDPTAAHIDHIHIELNWPGARERTSFWRSPLAPKAGGR